MQLKNRFIVIDTMWMQRHGLTCKRNSGEELACFDLSYFNSVKVRINERKEHKL